MSLKKIYFRPLVLLLTFAISSTIQAQPLWAQDGGISDIPFELNTGDFDVDDEFDVDAEWDEYEEFATSDPYEKYNRWMFNINDKLYRKVFAPLSKSYDFIIPKKVQGSINNFARFTTTPKRLFNNLFQKKFKSSWIEFERFLINASLGIGGIFDPAESVFNLHQQTEDFGQTLGTYNVGSGPYIIWPVVGPSTARDALGLGVDQIFSPFLWFSIYNVDPEDAWRAISGTKRVNNYTFNVRDNYDRITDSAIDPYIALQHAYIQNREKKIDQ